MDLNNLRKFRNLQDWAKILGDKFRCPVLFKKEARFEHHLQFGGGDDGATNWLHDNLGTFIQDDIWAPFKYGLELLLCKVMYRKGNHESALEMFQKKEIILLSSSPRDLILYGDMLVYQASYILRNVLVTLPPQQAIWNFTKDIIKLNYDKGNALRSSAYHYCNVIENEATRRIFTAEDLELAGFIHGGSIPTKGSDVPILSIESINGLDPSDRSYRLALNDVYLNEASVELKSKILCNYPFKFGKKLAGCSWRTIISNIKGLLVDESNQSATTLNGGLTIAEDVLLEDLLQLVLLKIVFRKESDGLGFVPAT